MIAYDPRVRSTSGEPVASYCPSFNLWNKITLSAEWHTGRWGHGRIYYIAARCSRSELSAKYLLVF